MRKDGVARIEALVPLPQLPLLFILIPLFQRFPVMYRLGGTELIPTNRKKHQILLLPSTWRKQTRLKLLDKLFLDKFWKWYNLKSENLRTQHKDMRSHLLDQKAASGGLDCLGNEIYPLLSVFSISL